MSNTIVSYEDAVLRCAQAAHEMNRVYCQAHGDDSQPPWEQAPDWQKTSAVNGVRGALAGNTPAQAHAGWLAEKRRDGWTHGPVKDPSKKEHPCMVPYDALPPAQQEKDRLYLETVRSMARALGLAP